MTAAVERLTKLVRAEDRFAIPYSELRDAQVEAMNERFQERKDRIKLLGHPRQGSRASPRSASRDDMVPLLFPHTAYKSYPESFLTEQKWDRLGKWLGTVSSYPIAPIETSDIDDIDDWIEPARGEGPLRLLLERHDRQVGDADRLRRGHGLVARRHGRRVLVGLGRRARAGPPDVRRGADRRTCRRTATIAEAQAAAFGDPRFEPFRFPVPPITVGSLTKMVVLRKAIADGTARPEEIAEFEAHRRRSAQETLDKAIVITAEALDRRPRRQAVHRGPVERAVPGRQAGAGRWATAPRTSIPTTASTSAAG